MLVEEKDLEVGVEYWLDGCKDVSGIFVKGNEDTLYFKRVLGWGYGENLDGFIPFGYIGYEYEKKTNETEKTDL